MKKHKLAEIDSTFQPYLEKCRRVAAQSYSPYSKFKVGSVVVSPDKQAYAGTNVENVSYSLCMCAERNAVYQAVIDGKTTLQRIFIYIEGSRFAHPCGACLQVMTEFLPLTAPLVIFNDSDEYIEEPLSYFIPHPFDRNILFER